MYFVRYGVVNWIPTYLETHKHFSFQQSSIGWLLYEFAEGEAWQRSQLAAFDDTASRFALAPRTS
jgi:hypothetical protein